MYRLVAFSALLSLSLLLLSASNSHAQEVKLEVDPAVQTVARGSTFQIEIRVSTGTQRINQVKADLTFDNAVVTPQSIDTTNSFIDSWYSDNTNNSINPSSGVVTLVGGVNTPGITGDNLLFATITFVANTAATTQLQFNNQSAIFRDSDNFNILTDSGRIPGIVTVSASLTPEPSGSITISPTPTAPTTVTPTKLPDAGTTTPTFFLVIIGIILMLGAVMLLR